MSSNTSACPDHEFKLESEVKYETIKVEAEVKQETCLKEECEEKQEVCSCTFAAKEYKVTFKEEELITFQDQLIVANNGIGICCPKCTKHFFYERYLNEHTVKEHSNSNIPGIGQEEIVDCFAGASSMEIRKEISPADLSSSLNQNHSENKLSESPKDKPFCCLQCAYKSNRKTNLARHSKVVHSEERPFSCPECTYKSKCKGALRLHQKHVHSEERPFSCPECAYKSKSKGALRIHQKHVHSNERPFSCPECTYKSKSKAALVWHVKYVHSEQRPFCCPECTYKSKTKEALRIHQKHVHSEERPFSFPECTDKFKTNQQLLQHSRCTHSVGDHWICSKCPYESMYMNKYQREIDVEGHFRHVHQENRQGHEENINLTFSRPKRTYSFKKRSDR